MANKKSEENIKEVCPKCGGKEFAIAKDMTSKRFCSKCHHVWLPLTKVEIQLDKSKRGNIKAREFAEMVSDSMSSLLAIMDDGDSEMSEDALRATLDDLQKRSQILLNESLN